MTNVAAMHRTARLLIATVGLMGIVAGSCSSNETDRAASSGGGASSPADVSGEIVVFAASSLTEAFTEMADAFEALHPETTVTLNFAGSGDLVNQISQGAPADVFVSADDANMAKLVAAGETADDPVSIAANTMEIIVEKGNPTAITGLQDLAAPDLIVVLCSDTVPCGKNAAAVLANAAVTVSPKSLEDKVKGVVTKVITGEADAGIVFVTDVIGAGDKAAGVAIPADVNVISNYPMVVTKQAPNSRAGRAFVDFVASAAGQAILARSGFLAP